MRLPRYPIIRTRKPIQLESDELLRLIEALAKALDNLATSLETRTDPRMLPDHSRLFERLEKFLQEAQLDTQISGPETVGNPKSSETATWLFYHLKNVNDLTLAAPKRGGAPSPIEGLASFQWLM